MYQIRVTPLGIQQEPTVYRSRWGWMALWFFVRLQWHMVRVYKRPDAAIRMVVDDADQRYFVWEEQDGTLVPFMKIEAIMG